ncbi:hypothetical protein C7M84_015224 [Penaeus vannamei]|uniref:Uncharacterized protein n=1 Tax=Penaeus vannamei TaxID=6689 RepID=A0A3R7PCL2_PENVA|nr:hypothetical protein C7M84_015224 [Penaeus vannamei]
MQRRPGLPRNRFASLLQASDQALIPRKSVLPSWLRHSGTRLGGRSAQVGRAVTSRQSTLSRSGGWTYCAHLCVFSFPRFPTPFRYLQGLAKMENKGFDVEKQESYELQDSPRKENSPAINEIVPACPCEDSQRNCSCKEPKEAKPQAVAICDVTPKTWDVRVWKKKGDDGLITADVALPHLDRLAAASSRVILRRCRCSRTDLLCSFSFSPFY